MVYADSWGDRSFVPSRALKEIRKAVSNFFQILKPGGILYVDITGEKEKQSREEKGIAEINRKKIKVVWDIQHNNQAFTRSVTIKLKFIKPEKEENYKLFSYLLPHKQLVKLLKEVGFKRVYANIMVKGESNYDVFAAKK